MSKLAWMLTASTALILSACSGPAEEAADHDGGHDAHTPTAEAPAPLADDGVTPVIDVRAVWMRPHPQGRDVTAAYFTVYLAEGRADRFVGAEIDGAERVELHGHSMDPDNGMMRMHEIGTQDISDAGPMVFVPGGRHLMVFGLAPASEGDTIPGRLIFERAGAVDVVFEVRSAPPGPTEY